MALNPDRVGHRYPSYRYEVCREKVREYALAIGEEDPVYTADPADIPPSDVVAPPTFAACFTIGRMGALLDDAELGAHPNLVHGTQAFDFHRPVRVGDLLECTPSITSITTRERMDILEYQVDVVHARSGEAVVTARSSLIFFAPEGG